MMQRDVPTGPKERLAESERGKEKKDPRERDDNGRDRKGLEKTPPKVRGVRKDHVRIRNDQS